MLIPSTEHKKRVRALYSISVIIPCYNCETTLAATVESVLAAGLGDCELILVDDGSTDGTAALCDALSAKYDRLCCVHQPNAGVSAARNRGIEEARGEYIWFVDADDTVDEGAMAPAARMAEEQRPDMLIFGMSFDYYHRGRLYRRDDLVPPCEGTFSLEKLMGRFRALYESNSLSSACTKLFRRELLLRHNTRFHTDMHLMEDFLFVLEALPHCETISCLPEAIYRYRQGEDERGAYRRLRRIGDLAAYMRPFEAAIERLGVPDAEELMTDFYRMLLRQRLYYAPLRELRETLTAHEQGRYAPCLGESALRIYLKNTRSRLRHRVAVAVKSAGWRRNRTCASSR